MKTVPNATLQRYPLYLKALRRLKDNGRSKIMSNELAEYVNIKPTTIRRDFSLIGSLGKQGYGYDIQYLIDTFSNQLGMNFDEKIILIGAGNLGRAILNYNRWNNVVGEIVCAFDKEPDKCRDLTVPVYNIDDLKEYMPEGCRIAILCIPSGVQETVDSLCQCGIKGIVDFSNEHFTAPEGVHVRYIDVVSSIQELVFETNSMQ